MPSPYVSKLAKETGKSVAEIEKLWSKAKKIASETLGKSEDDFGNSEYKYTVGIIKNMLGLNENLLDPSIFLKSGKTAKEFIKETVTSANFTIGDVNPVSVSPNANDGKDDAEKQTFNNFPGTDAPEEYGQKEEHKEVPQGSADVGEFLTDLNPDLREGDMIDPENKDDLRSLEDDEKENTEGAILPPDDYYDQFLDEDDPFVIN